MTKNGGKRKSRKRTLHKRQIKRKQIEKTHKKKTLSYYTIFICTYNKNYAILYTESETNKLGGSYSG